MLCRLVFWVWRRVHNNSYFFWDINTSYCPKLSSFFRVHLLLPTQSYCNLLLCVTSGKPSAAVWVSSSLFLDITHRRWVSCLTDISALSSRVKQCNVSDCLIVEDGAALSPETSLTNSKLRCVTSQKSDDLSFLTLFSAVIVTFVMYTWNPSDWFWSFVEPLWRKTCTFLMQN